MPIYDNHKLIFIHVPKCAGTSINNYYCPGLQSRFTHPSKFSLNLMYGRELQHITARKMSFLAPFRFKKYFKFAFVRNPYRRVESEFNWRKSWDSATKKMSLSTFIDTIPYRLNEPHFMPANKFLFTSNGTVLVDFIGKFENMESDLQKINQLAGVNVEGNIGKANVSQKVTSLTENDKKKIHEIYQEDFRAFNYDV